LLFKNYNEQKAKAAYNTLALKEKLPPEEKRILSCIKYIKMLIESSEKDGLRDLIPHKGLVQGYNVTISISACLGEPYRLLFTIQCLSNITLWELKKLICFNLTLKTQPDGTVI